MAESVAGEPAAGGLSHRLLMLELALTGINSKLEKIPDFISKQFKDLYSKIEIDLKRKFPFQNSPTTTEDFSATTNECDDKVKQSNDDLFISIQSGIEEKEVTTKSNEKPDDFDIIQDIRSLFWEKTQTGGKDLKKSISFETFEKDESVNEVIEIKNNIKLLAIEFKKEIQDSVKKNEIEKIEKEIENCQNRIEAFQTTEKDIRNKLEALQAAIENIYNMNVNKNKEVTTSVNKLNNYIEMVGLIGKLMDPAHESPDKDQGSYKNFTHIPNSLPEIYVPLSRVLEILVLGNYSGKNLQTIYDEITNHTKIKQYKYNKYDRFPRGLYLVIRGIRYPNYTFWNYITDSNTNIRVVSQTSGNNDRFKESSFWIQEKDRRAFSEYLASRILQPSKVQQFIRVLEGWLQQQNYEKMVSHGVYNRTIFENRRGHWVNSK